MPFDWLDPQAGAEWEDPIFCQSCGCYVDRRLQPVGPEMSCPDQLCGCHSLFWMTIPENEKRALWGDR